MTKPIIGIIGRRNKIVSDIEREGNVVLYDYMNALDKEGASYFGLITNDKYDFIDENILKLCDGILMTGGVEIKTYHMEIIKYAISHRIPFLGICQGSQALALFTLTGAKLLKIDEMKTSINHVPKMIAKEDFSNIVHKVNLNEGSILYELFGNQIDVNSNHCYTIPEVKEPMKIVGLSEDGLIEALEYNDNDNDYFMVGVQWHPENMESMQPLFREFVNRTRKVRDKK